MAVRQVRERELRRPEGLVVSPAGQDSGTGVLVLSGSSGRVERDRARVLGQAGVTALTYRWFDDDGQPPAIHELPLESFDWAVESLLSQCSRIVLMGASKSAEAFLAYAADDPRVDAVVALAPSHVVWANVGPGPDGQLRPQTSSWSRRGKPLPFVPFDDDVVVSGDPPAFAPMYRQSLQTFADRVALATIPVERFFGDVLLVAGGDDQVWPALEFARSVEARRSAQGLPTTVVTHPDAGHRVILPGERPASGGQRMARGGTEEGDRALGMLAWPELLRVLEVA